MAKTIALALVAFTSSETFATEFDAVQFWTGEGTNRAALVIH